MGPASSSALRASDLDASASGRDPYGSLAGLGGPRKLKKKPVLVLAPEELEQAHLMFQQASAEMLGEEPPQRHEGPTSFLGLAPIDNEDASPEDMGQSDELDDHAEDDLPSPESLLKIARLADGDPDEEEPETRGAIDLDRRIFPSLPLLSDEELAAEELAAEHAAGALFADDYVAPSMPNLDFAEEEGEEYDEADLPPIPAFTASDDDFDAEPEAADLPPIAPRIDDGFIAEASPYSAPFAERAAPPVESEAELPRPTTPPQTITGIEATRAIQARIEALRQNAAQRPPLPPVDDSNEYSDEDEWEEPSWSEPAASAPPPASLDEPAAAPVEDEPDYVPVDYNQPVEAGLPQHEDPNPFVEADDQLDPDEFMLEVEAVPDLDDGAVTQFDDDDQVDGYAFMRAAPPSRSSFAGTQAGTGNSLRARLVRERELAEAEAEAASVPGGGGFFGWLRRLFS